MIARVIRSTAFDPIVWHGQEKAAGGRPLSSSALSIDPNGPSPREILFDFRAVTEVKEVLSPVVHIPIWTRERETLTEEQWLLVAERVQIEMGYAECPWAAYLHDSEGKTKGQHLHLVLSRVTFGGRIVSDRSERYRIVKVMRRLEADLGFQPAGQDAEVPPE